MVGLRTLRVCCGCVCCEVRRRRSDEEEQGQVGLRCNLYDLSSSREKAGWVRCARISKNVKRESIGGRTIAAQTDVRRNERLLYDGVLSMTPPANRRDGGVCSAMPGGTPCDGLPGSPAASWLSVSCASDIECCGLEAESCGGCQAESDRISAAQLLIRLSPFGVGVIA